MTDKKDYMEYIARLIDRDLQEKQASGFTLWAILGVLFYLSFDIIDKLPTILEWPHIRVNSLFIIVITINFLVFIISLVFSLIFINNFTSKRKITTKFNSKNEVKYYTSILLLILGYFNIKVAFQDFSTMFYAWGVYFLSYGFLPYIELGRDLRRRYILKKLCVKFNSDSSTTIKIVSIVTSIYSLFSIYILTNIIFNTNIPSKENIVAIKIAIELFTFFILSRFFVDQLIVLKASKWLVDLEQDIYIDNLEAEDIKNRLEREYIGQSIERWVSEESREYEKIIAKIEAFYQEINLHINNLKQIQKTIRDKDFKAIDAADFERLDSEKNIFINKSRIFREDKSNCEKRAEDICEILESKINAIIDQQNLDFREKQELLKILKFYREITQKSIEQWEQLYSNIDDYEKELVKFQTMFNEQLKEHMKSHIK